LGGSPEGRSGRFKKFRNKKVAKILRSLANTGSVEVKKKG